MWSALLTVLACAGQPGNDLAQPLGWWNEGLARAREAWLERLDGGRATIPRSATWSVERRIWRGRAVALATERDDYDPILVQRVLDALDAYAAACARLCGDSPPPPPDVPPAVGARALVLEDGTSEAGGEPGVAIVRIDRSGLEDILRAAIPNDSRMPLGDALPQSFAVTYFFFQPELGPAAAEGSTAPAEAYAFLLAGAASDELGWVPPPETRPLDAIADAFADPTVDMDALGPLTDRDQWTALLVRIRNASGRRDFVERLWRATAECPPADSVEAAMANLIVVTSAAAEADQVARFTSWGFAVDESTRQRVREALEPKRLDVPRE